MATETTNYGLKKFESGDAPDLTALGPTMDKIDTELAQRALEEDLIVERNRINNLSTLSEGSTTGDAELIDIRTGENGENYASAGESVRKQFASVNAQLADNVNQIRSKLDKSIIKGFNLFDGVFSNLASNAGLVITGAAYRSIILTAVKGKTYKINTMGSHNRFIVAGSNALTVGSAIETLYTKTTSGNESYSYTNTTDYAYLLVILSITNQEPSVLILDSDSLSIGDIAVMKKQIGEVKKEHIDYGAVTTDRTDFIDYKYNLFDGQYITGKAIDVSGANSAIIAVTNGRMVAFEVKNTEYAVKVEGVFNRFAVTFSNSLDLNTYTYPVVKTTTPTSPSEVVATNTEGYKYLIIYVSSIGQEPNLIVCEGTEVLASPVLKIKGNEVVFKDDIEKLISLNQKKYASNFEVDLVNSGVPSTYIDLYSLYDELVTNFPNYVTKSVLGTNSQGYELISYKFSKPNVVNDVGLLRPKVGILASIHGDEKGPGVASLNFLNELCENPNENEILNRIKSMVDFYVIPTGNPTGWNNNTRKNGNGVDLNRNFPTLWAVSDPASNQYGGPSVASELETQLIMNWLTTNDFDYFIDFHNTAFGNETYPDEINTFSWFSTAKDENEIPLKRMYSKLLSLLSTLWADKYSQLPQNNMFGYSRDLTGPTAHIHAATLGAKAVTLEASWKIGYFDNSKYGTYTNTWATELIGNYVFEICKEFV